MTRALVLGGRGGIGSAVAGALRTIGFAVDSVDLSPADASPADTSPAGGEPAGPGSEIVLDLTDDVARERWITAYLSEPGAPGAVAWCAGIYHRRDIREYATPDIRRVVDANLIGLLALLPPLVRAAVEAETPMRLCVVGSQAGVTGGTDIPYAASKAGVVAAVKSIARDYARRGITANVVSPGPVDTPMASVMGAERKAFYEQSIPLGRYSRADEVADTVVWLLTAAPEAITGAVVDVDGGLVRR